MFIGGLYRVQPKLALAMIVYFDFQRYSGFRGTMSARCSDGKAISTREEIRPRMSGKFSPTSNVLLIMSRVYALCTLDTQDL